MIVWRSMGNDLRNVRRRRLCRKESERRRRIERRLVLDLWWYVSSLFYPSLNSSLLLLDSVVALVVSPISGVDFVNALATRAIALWGLYWGPY